MPLDLSANVTDSRKRTASHFAAMQGDLEPTWTLKINGVSHPYPSASAKAAK